MEKIIIGLFIASALSCTPYIEDKFIILDFESVCKPGLYLFNNDQAETIGYLTITPDRELLLPYPQRIKLSPNLYSQQPLSVTEKVETLKSLAQNWKLKVDIYDCLNGPCANSIQNTGQLLETADEISHKITVDWSDSMIFEKEDLNILAAKPTSDEMMLHKYFLSSLWSPTMNIPLVLLAIFPFNKGVYILHVISSIIVISCTCGLLSKFLISYGYFTTNPGNLINLNHGRIGITVFSWMFLQAIFGVIISAVKRAGIKDLEVSRNESLKKKSILSEQEGVSTASTLEGQKHPLGVKSDQQKGFFKTLWHKMQQPTIFLRIKYTHRFCGYVLLLLAKCNLLMKWYKPGQTILQFVLFLTFEVICILIFIERKLHSSRMQKLIGNRMHSSDDLVPTHQISNQGSKSELVEVRVLSDLDNSKAYFIFGNKIYELNRMIPFHPGGGRLLRLMKGRDVDRFIYGMYSNELYPEIKAHSHTSRSIALAGDPVGILTIPSPMANMPLVGSYSLHHASKISSITYLLHFELKSQPSQEHKQKGSDLDAPFLEKSQQNRLKFKGYESVNQLGRFYSVTSGEITRLYTSVYCMLPENMEEMSEILSKQGVRYDEQRYIARCLNSMKGLSPQNEEEFQEIFGHSKDDRWNRILNKRAVEIDKSEEYLPLMMKRYPQGKLSPILTEPCTSDILISSPKGQGLALGEIGQGKVIIIAGGTGFFPFVDLVDLLFKQSLLLHHHSHSERILKQNPILNHKPFLKNKFKIYLAVMEPDDIHQMTLQQLAYLTAQPNSMVEVTFRVFSEKEEHIKHKYHMFQATSAKFQELIVLDLNKEESQIAKIYVCGPPIMNTAVGNALNHINQSFTFV